MISKELYSPATKEDEAIMIMAKNQIEIDEYLLAKEFEEALEKQKKKASKVLIKNLLKATTEIILVVVVVLISLSNQVRQKNYLIE